MNTYIHYGHRHFDGQNSFKEVENKYGWNKPLGGLWASNINCRYGWKEWVDDNDFHFDKYTDNRWFKFTLKDDAKVLTITDVSQLKDLPQQADKPKFAAEDDYFLDFEKLKDDYDAIELIINDNLYFALYGWDCDCILILNKDIVVETKSSDNS